MSFSKDGIALATTKAILGPAAREDVQKEKMNKHYLVNR
jgi:hypothetical protein